MEDSHDPKLVEALNEAENQFREIRVHANNAGLEDDEKEMALLSSGFALGWARYKESYKEDRHNDGTELALVNRSVSVMRTAYRLLSDGAHVDQEFLEPIRAVLYTFLAEYDRRKAEHSKATLVKRFGTRVAALILEGNELDDEECLEVGVSMIADNSMVFHGYVMFRDDERVRCKCPFHFVKAPGDFGITELQSNSALSSRYTSYRHAVIEFGRWYTEQIREIGRKTDGGADANAGEVTNDLMKRLTGSHGA